MISTWYDAAVGGNALGTGATYVTPQLFASTPYYVGAQAGIQESAGKPTYIGTDNTSGNAWGLVFDVVSSDIVIETVDVYSVGAGGSITVELRNSTGVLVLQSVGSVQLSSGINRQPCNSNFTSEPERTRRNWLQVTVCSDDRKSYQRVCCKQ
jgi:hypothetical protein